jgi:hypothetical protein
MYVLIIYSSHGKEFEKYDLIVTFLMKEGSHGGKTIQGLMKVIAWPCLPLLCSQVKYDGRRE